MRWSSCTLIALALAACTGPSGDEPGKDDADADTDADSDADSDTDTDTDTDSDTDADTDADTDSDTDADTGPPPVEECTPTDICAGGACLHDVALTVHTITGTVTWNGAAPPRDTADFTEDFRVTFRDASGRTYNGHGEDGGTYTAYLPADTYDVALTLYESDAEWAWGSSFPVGGPLVVTGDSTLDVAASAYAITGAVSWNGAAIPEDASIYLDVRFTNADGEEYVAGGDASSYTVRLPAGTYTASIQLDYVSDETLYTESEIPVGGPFVVTGDGTLDLAAELDAVHGAVTWNGAAAPADRSDDEDDFLVEFTDADGRTYSASGEAGAYATVLPPGTYSVTVALQDINNSARYTESPVLVDDALVVSGDTTADLAAVVHTVEGDVTWNGAAAPADLYDNDDDFSVVLTDAAGRTYTGVGEDGAYTALAPAGTYSVDLVFADPSDIALYTPGTLRVQDGLVVGGDTRADLAAVAYSVTGFVSWGDSPTGPDFHIYFTDTEGRTYAGYFRDTDDTGAYAIALPPGTYAVSVDVNNPPNYSDYARSPVLVHEGLVVSGDTTADLPVTVYDVTGAVTWNGAPAPSDDSDNGADCFLTFIDERGWEFDTYCENGAYSTRLPTGAYSMIFALNDLEEGAPYTDDELPLAECVEVTAP